MIPATRIETDASVDWLSDQGCDYGQGYLFGRAMPKTEMDDLLAEQRAKAEAETRAHAPEDETALPLARAS